MAPWLLGLPPCIGQWVLQGPALEPSLAGCLLMEKWGTGPSLTQDGPVTCGGSSTHENK